MANIAIEIGSHTVRAVVRTQEGIFDLELGESAGQYTMPSVFAKEEDGAIHVGFDAELWKYQAESYPIVEIEERERLYIEVVTTLFGHIFQKAKEQTREDINSTTVIVPTHYGINDPRKTFISKALDNNAVQNYCFVSAHQALCLAQACVENNSYVLVYDMGHSGLSVSLLQRQNNVFEVLKAKRIDGLGGLFFDSLIYGDIMEKCNPSEIDDLQYRALLNNQLEIVSSYAKERLSNSDHYHCPIPFSSKQYSITRKEFVEKIAPSVGKSFAACQNMASEATVNATEVSEVLLWGGSCKIPFVSERCIMQFKQINPSMKITDCTKARNSVFLACKGGLQNNSGVTLLF